MVTTAVVYQRAPYTLILTNMTQYNEDHIVFYNGQKMPIVGFGTWQASSEEIETALNTALEAGYRHIDTAYAYENEAAIGNVLKKWFDSGRLKREDIFIVTKLPPIGNRAESVEKYLTRSLTALQLKYVDLYLVHTPMGMPEIEGQVRPRDKDGNFIFEKTTDHIAIWKAMEAQVDAGRTKSIGLSNFNARQIKRVYKSARIPPANLQIELNVYFQQRELSAFCNALDITICAYGPLGSPGMLNFLKKYGRDTTNVKYFQPLTDPVVEKIAKKHSKTAAQVLLRYVMQRGIAVIPKSVNPSRIKENFQVFDFELSSEDVDELDSLDKGRHGRMLFGSAAFSGNVDHPENGFHEPY